MCKLQFAWLVFRVTSLVNLIGQMNSLPTTTFLTIFQAAVSLDRVKSLPGLARQVRNADVMCIISNMVTLSKGPAFCIICVPPNYQNLQLQGILADLIWVSYDDFSMV